MKTTRRNPLLICLLFLLIPLVGIIQEWSSQIQVLGGSRDQGSNLGPLLLKSFKLDNAIAHTDAEWTTAAADVGDWNDPVKIKRFIKARKARLELHAEKEQIVARLAELISPDDILCP